MYCNIYFKQINSTLPNQLPHISCHHVDIAYKNKVRLGRTAERNKWKHLDGIRYAGFFFFKKKGTIDYHNNRDFFLFPFCLMVDQFARKHFPVLVFGKRAPASSFIYHISFCFISE